MKREPWMRAIAQTDGRKSLYPYAIGVIREMLSDSSPAEEKVREIDSTLVDLKTCFNDNSLPWDLMEAKSAGCKFDTSKIAPLVDKAWAEEVLRKEG